MYQVVGWKYFTTEKQWETYLKDLLWYNDNALLKSILMIYNRQAKSNKIGFTKVDAQELGRLARKIKDGQTLTYAELERARNKMPKYWRQLMEILKQSEQPHERAAVDKIKQMEEKESNDKELDEQLKASLNRYKVKKQLFRESIEILRKCAEEGISCDYGICNECPLTKGYQLHLNSSVKDNGGIL